MSAALNRLDRLPAGDARRELLACCGSPEWARRMAALRPFRDVDRLLAAADRVWWSLSETEWRAAFASHPRIGDRAAAGDAASEQAGARSASPETLRELAAANREYEARFGHIFIVCASGRTADEMLALCRERLHNDAATELRTAAEEQRRITRLRLEKLAREP